jgi:lysophospholipase
MPTSNGGATRGPLVMGPGSWGWVQAAARSMQCCSPRRARAIDHSGALLSTTGDRLVSPRAIRRAAARLPDGELSSFGP